MSFVVAGARTPLLEPEDALHRAGKWASSHDSEVCLVDARTVVGSEHLESAALHAERSRDSGGMSARSLAMETLRYVAGKRQVRDAIRTSGLRPDARTIGIVLFGPGSLNDFIRDLGWLRDDSVLSAQGKSLDALGITASEVGTVPQERRFDLVLEKVATADLEK